MKWLFSMLTMDKVNTDSLTPNILYTRCVHIIIIAIKSTSSYSIIPFHWLFINIFQWHYLTTIAATTITRVLSFEMQQREVKSSSYFNRKPFYRIRQEYSSLFFYNDIYMRRLHFNASVCKPLFLCFWVLCDGRIRVSQKWEQSCKSYWEQGRD